MSVKPLHTIDWACRRFGVSRDVVYGWVRAGRLPHCRIGRRVFFDEDAVAEFIARGGRKLNPDGLEEKRRPVAKEAAR